MLEIILVVLLIAWFGGFLFHVGGDLIHLLLLVALAIFVYRLLTRYRG